MEFNNARKRPSKRASRKSAPLQLERAVIETLEKRMLLTSTAWKSAVSGDFDNASDWTNGVPGVGMSAIINVAGTYTVTLDENPHEIYSLTLGASSGTQTLVDNGPTLTLDAASSIASGGSVAMSSATIAGAGRLTNSGTISLQNATISAPLTNNATINVSGQGNSISGGLTTASTSIINLIANNTTGNAYLGVSNSFTNSGAINLTSNSNAANYPALAVGGTLTNASGATITANGAGSTVDPSTIAGGISNAGTITVSNANGLTISTNGAGASNSGTIADASGPLTISLSSDTFTNSKTITVGSGQTFTISGGSFATTSASAITVTGDDAHHSAAFDTVGFTNNGSLNLINNSSSNGYYPALNIESGSITNSSTGTISITGTAVTTPAGAHPSVISAGGGFTNNGVFSVADELNVTGSFTQSASGQTTLVYVQSNVWGVLAFASAPSVAGTLNYTLQTNFGLGSPIQIITFPSLTGSFGTINLPAYNGVADTTDTINSTNITVVSTPTITGVSPNPVANSASPQPLYVSGGPFVSGYKITLTDITTQQVYSNLSGTGNSTWFAVNETFPTAGDVWTVQVTNPGNYAGNVSTFTVVPPGQGSKDTGTIIGTVGSYNGDGNTINNAFDNNTGTFFDGPTANGDWAGLDLGAGDYAIVTQVRFYPRYGYPGRMVGGIFQGSNSSNFASGSVNLATISSTPLIGWNTIAVSNPQAFRYLRYLAPNSSYGDASELEFYGDVAYPPAANPASYTVNENATLTESATTGLLANETPQAGQTVTVSIPTGDGPTHGTLWAVIMFFTPWRGMPATGGRAAHNGKPCASISH
jgi:hypothetical protein